MNLTDKYKAKLKELETDRLRLLDKHEHAESIKDTRQAFAYRRQIDCLTQQIIIVDEVIKDLEVTSETELNEKIKQDKLHGY